MLLLRRGFWLTILKLAALAFIGAMGLVLIPELRYDLGPKTPIVIPSLEQLEKLGQAGPTFVAVEGRGDFEKAIIHKTYGVAFAYFLVKPYGRRLVVRTHERIEEEDWKRLDRFVGKLKTFRQMPFRRTIRAGFRDEFDVEIPSGAFFLARDDAPHVSGWQIFALIFVAVLWSVLFYIFLVFPLRKKRSRSLFNNRAAHHAQPE